MLLRELPQCDKPRERMMRNGIDSLSDVELLSIILKNGNRQYDVFSLAQQVLKLLNVEQHVVSLEQLLQIQGIGIAKASQILALFEFAKRKRTIHTKKLKIDTAKKVYDSFKHIFAHSYREEFKVVFLNTQLEIIDHENLFSGTIDSVTIHPREIYFRAIKRLAHSIIILHNHPSGNCLPSTADLDITARIEKVGDIVGIPLVDHIIFGDDSYWSWAENNKQKS